MKSNHEISSVTLSTDGGCWPNDGSAHSVGGWGVVLRFKDRFCEISGAEKPTTNNRMEMTAMIEGLRALRKRCAVVVRTDSQYLITVCKYTGWRYQQGNRKQKPKNWDLLQILMGLMCEHDVTFLWVRGHSGDMDNERCDFLASWAAHQLRKQKAG